MITRRALSHRGGFSSSFTPSYLCTIVVRLHTTSSNGMPICDRRFVQDYNLLPPELQTKGFALPVGGSGCNVPPCSDFYEVSMSRGSGPGGQGCNSSSNKVEMRVDIGLLELWLDEYLSEVVGVTTNTTSKAPTTDESENEYDQINEDGSNGSALPVGSSKEDDVAEEDIGRSEYELWKYCKVQLRPKYWPPIEVVVSSSSSQTSSSSSSGGGPSTSSSSISIALQQQSKIHALFPPTPAAHIVRNIAHHQSGRAVTGDGSTLILSSHQHRSAYKNEEECLLHLSQIVYEAGRVTLEAVRCIGGDGGSTTHRVNRATNSIIDRMKAKRRIKGNKMKVQQAVRAGKW